MKISITNESQRFLQFLQEKNNSNIIFSGIYGIGKSYFINDFFNNQHSKEYIPIILTPINYSVANNEDIFEYIKADILLQLLEKVPCDMKNCLISTSEATYYYIKRNLVSIIGNILSTAEKVGFKTDIIHQLLDLKKNIKKFQEENSLSEDKEIKSFMNQLSYKQGSIYESNIITQIIQTLISNAKKGEEPKEAILVIDDLDRIDPEHIFRILNILSAHNDFCYTHEHKFKFDKTILICDIDNIKKIFHTKYGTDVDFNGYIDKFYSKEIYYFQNENNIIDAITQQIYTRADYYSDELLSDGIGNQILRFILSALIRSKSINIRNLLRFNMVFNLNENVYAYHRKFLIGDILSITIFEIIEKLFINREEALKAMNTLSNYEINIHSVNFDSKHFLSLFIAIADFTHNRFAISTNNITHFYRNISYIIHENNGTACLTSKEITGVNIYKVIVDAYNNYYKYFSKIK